MLPSVSSVVLVGSGQSPPSIHASDRNLVRSCHYRFHRVLAMLCPVLLLPGDNGLCITLPRSHAPLGHAVTGHSPSHDLLRLPGGAPKGNLNRRGCYLYVLMIKTVVPAIGNTAAVHDHISHTNRWASGENEANIKRPPMENNGGFPVPVGQVPTPSHVRTVRDKPDLHGGGNFRIGPWAAPSWAPAIPAKRLGKTSLSLPTGTRHLYSVPEGATSVGTGIG